jgi:hypothetical protein
MNAAFVILVGPGAPLGKRRLLREKNLTETLA